MSDTILNPETGDCHQEIAMEQMRLFYNYIPQVVIGATVAAWITVYILSDAATKNQLVIWGSLFTLLSVVRFTHHIWLKRQFADLNLRQNLSIPNLRTIAILFSGLSGLAWGTVGVLFFDPTAPLLVSYIIIVLVGLTGTAVTSLSTYYPAYLAFSLPTVIPLCFRLFSEDQSLFIAHGILAIAALTANSGYGAKLQKEVLQSIGLRFEKEYLVKQLQQQKDSAVETSVRKSQFIAATSHDLRQPLNALRLFVGALKREKLPAKVEDIIDDIEISSKTLSDMLNAVLDMSKLDHDMSKPEVKEVPVQPILDRIQCSLSPIAKDKGLRLRTITSSAIIRTDPHMFERIIRNLVANACSYTNEGTVLVGCRHQNGGLRVEVWDTGIGISEIDQGRIFDAFHRTEDTQQDDHLPHLGLGLSIVKILADGLGHGIYVRSAPGYGSTFSVTVPKGIDQVNLTANASPNISDLSGLKLLIIDDDRLSRAGIREITKSWGCVVEETDGLEAASLVITRGDYSPDVIISDYRLGNGIDGILTIGAIRSLVGKKIPALLITGDTGPTLTSMANEAELPIVYKPVAPSTLLASVFLLSQGKAQ